MKQSYNLQQNHYAYQQLEKEVNDRHKKLISQSWRGNLSKEGLKTVSWGDLNNIKTSNT